MSVNGILTLEKFGHEHLSGTKSDNAKF